MSVNGTLINYYVHCKRQCYLHASKINLEDNSENVKIGKALHETKMRESSDYEIAIDNIKIDRMTKDYVIETKKSDADVDAAKWQLVYYLYILKSKGIIRKGKLEFIEKNKVKSSQLIELDAQLEAELMEMIVQLETLINSDSVPEATLTSKCKKCAYYYYCCI